MSLNHWFDKGLTSSEYIETLEKHKEAYLHIYEQFTVPETEQFLQSLRQENLRAVVLAEPWCGHCLLNIPVLLNLAEKVEMPVRFLLRDENLELMDQYLTNGKSRTIPILIFIDKDGNEVTKWGPIADNTKQFVDQHKKDLPPKEADNFKEEFSKMIEFFTEQFRNDPTFWQGSYDSIQEKLTVSFGQASANSN